METEITNLQQLKARIAFLEVKKAEDEIYFNQKFEAIKEKVLNPFKFIKETFSSLAFWNKTPNPGRADWATNFGRIFLPMFVNKTLLRNKGIIIKSLVSLFSQKAINASVLNKNILAGWVDKITDFVKSKTAQKEKRYGADDYGIPPDSETA